MSIRSDSARTVPDEGIPRLGSIVHGKYRIEDRLGAGGMGVVVKAHHLQLNQPVALKLINTKSDQNRIATARFLREARAAAALESEHVARVLDVGTLESGAPFMVMEYLEGENLSRIIRERAPMQIAEAVDVILQACAALAEAHAHGIIHRDIKPSNLFMAKRRDGSTLLKVLDFGISTGPALTDDGEPTLTESQMVLGSPQYLSPEQITDAKTADHRTDIWALGVVLYYMLAGRRPFEAESVSALFVVIATATPVRLSELRPDLPGDIDEVVMGCLEKDRESRVQSVTELASVLGPYATYPSRSAPVTEVAPVTGGDAPKFVLPPIRGRHPVQDSRITAVSPPAERPASRVGMLLIGAAILAAVMVAILLLAQGGEQPAPPLGTASPAQPRPSAAPSSSALPQPSSGRRSRP